MILEYVPLHRDDTEAASARFPGDGADPRAPGASIRVGAVGWLAVAVIVLTAGLLIVPRGNPSAVRTALFQADRIDHPVFVAGVLLTAIGGAMVVVPLVYLLGLQRSARPVIDTTVRIDLGEDVLTVRLPSKELTVAWQGVVAVAETRNLFVLKTLGDLRVVLPKRGAPRFSEQPAQAVDDLRERLRSRITPLARVEPVVPPRLAA